MSNHNSSGQILHFLDRIIFLSQSLCEDELCLTYCRRTLSWKCSKVANTTKHTRVNQAVPTPTSNELGVLFMVAADGGPRLKHVPGSPCVIVCFQFSYYLVCHWFSGSLIAQIRSPSIQHLQTHYALRSEIHGSKPPS